MLKDSLTRDELASWMRRDLLGPFRGSEERIRGRPTSRYLIGVLHPAFTAQADEETDEAAVAVSEDGAEAEANAAYGGIRQSAIGLSFVASVESAPRVLVSFAEYEAVQVPNEVRGAESAPQQQADSDEPSTDKKDDGTHQEWQRLEISSEIAMAELDGQTQVADGIQLEWRSRESSGQRVWTASLVNRRKQRGRSIFQPEIRVRMDDGDALLSRPRVASVSDPDEELNALLYRATPEYAVGHGCGAQWREAETVTEAWTDFMPAYEISAVLALSSTAAELRMDALAQLETGIAIEAAVVPLLDEYAAWMEAVRSKVGPLAEGFRKTAERNLAACDVAERRMRGGLRLLIEDPAALMAFRFMNLTMADQRRSSVQAAEYRATGIRADSAEIPTWRPFQLAFILLNLEGLARPESSERALVDLLWFPTGGGKTEAYLGLAAFAIGYRRITSADRDRYFLQGVTVLTRYTLRLLATQQFERAATLVAACELIRRQKPELWGRAPMAIGLWIGEAGSPNTFEAAQTRADEAKGLANPNEGHPFVLRSCPRCGEGLPFPAAFSLDPATRKVTVTCPYRGCPFSKAPGIPVRVVDEEVHREPPEILLATVDKLARMPWVGEAASIFGHAPVLCDHHGFFNSPKDHARWFKTGCELHDAPQTSGIDLVIQDELHLISGPLGSLVGLYEIATEFLAGRSGRPPKVVASTATIRSATDQVRALYGREDRLFPPPAIDAFDTFFAHPAPASTAPGRLYVGLAAPGASMKTALIRTYASLLAGVLAQHPDPGDDEYWTLVGYFNSLRELGGAVSFLQDDIPSRLGALFRSGEYPQRADLQSEELTSRIPSTEIPDRLRRMEQVRSSGSAMDVMVATNMISVGVDVDRLGLMVVAGQPKGTAEYVQATSRVGRAYPGLVVAVYNWTRPRDLSHYESFQTYHASIYRHVEATSVTPLSPRARDRGLHAVLVAALRLADAALNEDGAASNVPVRRHEATASGFLREFSRRAGSADPSEGKAAESQLKRLLDQWVERAEREAIVYGRGSGPRLLKAAQAEAEEALSPPDPKAWATLNSLRSVEPEHSWFEK